MVSTYVLCSAIGSAAKRETRTEPPLRRVSTPGWFDAEAQAQSARAASERALRGGGHGGSELRTPYASQHKYWCPTCSRGFDRQKQLAEHVAGRAHAAALVRGEESWAAWQKSSWFDPRVPREAVTGAWSIDEFLYGLPVRSRSRGGPKDTSE